MWFAVYPFWRVLISSHYPKAIFLAEISELSTLVLKNSFSSSFPICLSIFLLNFFFLSLTSISRRFLFPRQKTLSNDLRGNFSWIFLTYLCFENYPEESPLFFLKIYWVIHWKLAERIKIYRIIWIRITSSSQYVSNDQKVTCLLCHATIL